MLKISFLSLPYKKKSVPQFLVSMFHGAENNTVPKFSVPKFLVPKFLVPKFHGAENSVPVFPVLNFLVPKFPVPKFLVPKFHGAENLVP